MTRLGVIVVYAGLAVVAWLMLGLALDRSEQVRRNRIISHACQDRAWCWPLLEKENKQ